MKILSISTSTVVHKKSNSGSIRACEIVGEIIGKRNEKISYDILPLVNLNLKPCIFCGKCKDAAICPFDSDFNKLIQQMHAADAMIFVVPHYSIIPAKLTIVMEKLNQLFYTAWLKDPKSKFALSGKRVALIAHGGGDNRNFDHYRKFILEPLNYLFKSLGFQLVNTKNQKEPFGAIFGIKGMKDVETSIFPDMLHDWDQIKTDLEPLIDAIILSK